MKLKHLNALLLAGAVLLSATLKSCKGGKSDATIQEQVNKELAAEAGSGITATVSNGVVTLTGTCKDEPCRENAAAEAKEIDGVKSVVNNITLAPAETTAPVEITADAQLQEAVNNVVK